MTSRGHGSRPFRRWRGLPSSPGPDEHGVAGGGADGLPAHVDSTNGTLAKDVPWNAPTRGSPPPSSYVELTARHELFVSTRRILARGAGSASARSRVRRHRRDRLRRALRHRSRSRAGPKTRRSSRRRLRAHRRHRAAVSVPRRAGRKPRRVYEPLPHPHRGATVSMRKVTRETRHRICLATHMRVSLFRSYAATPLASGLSSHPSRPRRRPTFPGSWRPSVSD